MEARAVFSIKDLKTYFYNYKQGAVIKAVDGVSLDAYAGKITAIVGQSGSGKSVMALSVFNLVDEPGRIEAGEIFVNGRDVIKLSKRKQRHVYGKEIAMIFQDPSSALNPVVKVKKQLLEAIRIHEKTSRPDALRRCEQALLKVGLTNTGRILESYPFELSGGMCQRVMIAMALLTNPSVLIADEPTTALDLTIQAEILDELLKLKEQGMAIILITHDLSVVAQTADYVYVMSQGRIVESGEVCGIFEHPRHEYTKGLLEAIL